MCVLAYVLVGYSLVINMRSVWVPCSLLHFYGFHL